MFRHVVMILQIMNYYIINIHIMINHMRISSSNRISIYSITVLLLLLIIMIIYYYHHYYY